MEQPKKKVTVIHTDIRTVLPAFPQHVAAQHLELKLVKAGEILPPPVPCPGGIGALRPGAELAQKPTPPHAGPGCHRGSPGSA